MTREDKIRVIRRWTHTFNVERSAVGEYYAWVSFYKGIKMFHTDQYPSRYDLIDDAYSKIKLLVWQFMMDELCDYVYDY